MITALVLFTLPTPMPSSKLAELSAANAPMYKDKAGLIRKYYVGSDDGLRIGGVYLWESRAAGEAVYDDAWLERVTSAYGSAPTITWYDTPVVVDNRAGEIVT